MSLTDLLQNQLELGVNPLLSKDGSIVLTDSVSSTTNDLFCALNEVGNTSATQTAASRLLEEKKKLKQRLTEIESTNFSIPRENTLLSPLMQQVAENNNTFDFSQHLRKNKGKKQTQVHHVSKKSMKIKEKGEAYSDRMKEKLMKQKMKSKLRK